MVDVKDDQVVDELRALMHQQGALPLPEGSMPATDDVERVLWRIRAQDRRERVRSGAWATAAAAVLAAVVVVASTFLGSAPATAFPVPLEYSLVPVGDAASGPAASDALRAAARAVRRQEISAAGDVHHVVRSGWLLTVDTGGQRPDLDDLDLVPALTETWLAPDGSLRMDQSRWAPLDPDGRLRAPAEATSEPQRSTDLSPAGTFDPRLPDTLPRDPDQLRAALLDPWQLPAATASAEVARFLIDEIAMLHGLYVIPPDLTAAMWELLARTPEVRHLGMTATRDGHPAQGFAVTWEQPDRGAIETLVLHVSSTTGRFLGTETIVLNDPALGITTPTLTGFEVHLHADFVAEIGQRYANVTQITPRPA